jgi:hypothetical protein
VSAAACVTMQLTKKKRDSNIRSRGAREMFVGDHSILKTKFKSEAKIGARGKLKARSKTRHFLLAAAFFQAGKT